jgi:L-cysteate sulfo-lyase
MREQKSIADILQRFPTANLTLAPTAIQRLERLSSHLGHNIYVKRDDLTGFCLGGNKVRKLDYLLSDAKVKNADTLVTKRATSFSRNAAAAGKALGFDVHVFIMGEEATQNQASQALFKRLGATLHFVSGEQNELDTNYQKYVESLRERGRSVYELHPGGSDAIGTLSYVKAFAEILDYSKKSTIHFDKIFHATGSAATQAGLVLGQCISGYEASIIGIAISQKAEIQKTKVLELARTTAQMLEVDLDDSKVIVDDNYIGPGYPDPSEAGMKATEMFVQMEGILLDQVYGGKAAAGVIDYAATGRFSKGDNILFIHTGGNSDLYY